MKAVFRKSFARDLKRIKDQGIRNRILQAIEQVESVSNLQSIDGLKKLSGSGSFFRIRIGDYRIGLAFDGESVEFVRCLPRRDLYRYFP